MAGNRIVRAFLLVMAIVLITGCGTRLSDPHPVVTVETTLGTFELTLDGEGAPKTVRNFLDYVNDGFYNGTVIHRVTPRLIQGGGYDARNRLKEPRSPIKNESSPDRSHIRGTIAMARDSNIHSADSQFFINHRNNTALDNMQFTVFGNVTAGMDVVDSIAAIETYRFGPDLTEYPVKPVEIISVHLTGGGITE